ncbi:MAG: glycoside hydrolase family 16 protein [Bacteroidia bacterium]|nr:glycoside hydrolase family 16 protein [Bacteroidia bacterium]
MKKLILFLLLITFALTALIKNMQAQLITNDKNWNTTPVFGDEFNGPRSPWSYYWVDSVYQNKWQAAYDGNTIHMQASWEHEVFRKANAIIDTTNGNAILHAEYNGGLIPWRTYDLVPGHSRDTVDTLLYYWSGSLTSVQTFKYGYFEARCKLPSNRGAFPAFWLFNWYCNDCYREIDIMEHSWEQLFTYQHPTSDSARIFNGGLYYSNVPNVINRYGDHCYYVAPPDSDMYSWHTYAAEWSPKRVIWYFDNKVISEYLGDSVPENYMKIILNYAVDAWALDYYTKIPIPSVIATYPNNMTIDYVHVNQLKCGCDTNAVIQNNSQLLAYYYSVKKTITIDGNGTTIAVPASSKAVFRATDGITINKDFEVPLDSELDLITHPCPQ